MPDSVAYLYKKYFFYINLHPSGRIEVREDPNGKIEFTDKSFVFQKVLRNRRDLLLDLSKPIEKSKNLFCKLKKNELCKNPISKKISLAISSNGSSLYLFLPKKYGYPLLKKSIKESLVKPKTNHAVYKQNIRLTPFFLTDGSRSSLITQISGNLSKGSQYLFYNASDVLYGSVNGSFVFNGLEYGRYHNFWRFRVGLVGGSGGVFIRGLRLWGVDLDQTDRLASLEYKNRLNKEILITLDQESIVKIYDDRGRLIKTQILLPGVQFVSTNGFPPINGVIKINIYDASNRFIRSVYRDFNNRGSLPSALFSEKYINLGIEQDTGYSYIGYRQVQRVLYGRIVWQNQFLLYDNAPYYETRLGYYHWVNVSPSFLVDPTHSVFGFGMQLTTVLPGFFDISFVWRSTGGHQYDSNSLVQNDAYGVRLSRSHIYQSGLSSRFFLDFQKLHGNLSGLSRTAAFTLQKNIQFNRSLVALGSTVRYRQLDNVSGEKSVYLSLSFQQVIKEVPDIDFGLDVNTFNGDQSSLRLRLSKRNVYQETYHRRRDIGWDIESNFKNNSKTNNYFATYHYDNAVFSGSTRLLRQNNLSSLAGHLFTSLVVSSYGSGLTSVSSMSGYGIYSGSKKIKFWSINSRLEEIPMSRFILIDNYRSYPSLYSQKLNLYPFNSLRKKSELAPHLIDVLPPLKLVKVVDRDITVVDQMGMPLEEGSSVIAPKPCDRCITSTGQAGRVNVSYAKGSRRYYYVFRPGKAPCRFSINILPKNRLICKTFNFI